MHRCVHSHTHTHSSNAAQGPTPTKVILIKKGPGSRSHQPAPFLSSSIDNPDPDPNPLLLSKGEHTSSCQARCSSGEATPSVSPIPVTTKAGAATDPSAQKLPGQVPSLPMCQLPDTPAARSPTHSSPPHEWLALPPSSSHHSQTAHQETPAPLPLSGETLGPEGPTSWEGEQWT